MSKTEPITLRKMPLAYVLVVLFVVLPTVWMLAFSNVVDDVWCQSVQLPTYEKALGFRMDLRTVPGGLGSQKTLAVVWVDPDRPFSAAGVRVGDVPRMYHGVRDFCTVLSPTSKGQPVQLELRNLEDVRQGVTAPRTVTVRPAAR